MKGVRKPLGSEKENMLEEIDEYTEKSIEREKRKDDGSGHASIYEIKCSIDLESF